MSQDRKPVLAYWAIRGLAAPIRLLLAYCKEDYEDRTYGDGPDRDKWFDEKFTLGFDFPNLPYYIDGDLKITQSNAIARYIARKHSLCGSTEQERVTVDILENQLMDFRNGFVRLCYGPGFEENKKTYITNLPKVLKLFSDFLAEKDFLVGREVTFVDFIAFELFDQHSVFHSTAFDEFSNLKKYMDRVRNLPAIKAYYEAPDFQKLPINSAAAYFK